MSNYILPILIIALIIYALFKKRNVYLDFVDGAKQSLNLIYDIFAFIVAIFIIVEILNQSGLTQILTNLLSPVFNFLGIPKELTKLILVKPFSGNGSLAILQEIFDSYGADSYIGRCACVILGTSETIFYVTTVYFSKTKVKRIGIAVPIALLCMFVSIILSCLACRIM